MNTNTNDNDKPSATDVLFGRGGSVYNFPGNITFRKVLQSKLLMYDAAKTIREKQSITLSIVHEMKEQLHHRFLKEDEKTGVWKEVTNDEIARQKVAVALRDLRKARRPPKSKQQEQKQQKHNHDSSSGTIKDRDGAVGSTGQKNNNRAFESDAVHPQPQQPTGRDNDNRGTGPVHTHPQPQRGGVQ